MAAEIFTAISALRMVLNSETDADSPDNETTFAAIRVAIESLFLILLGTGFDGTVSGISTTTITHAESAQVVDVHNGRTTLMTSGACKGNFYTIDDGAAQTLIHTGDDLEADGVAIGDTFQVLYDIKANLDGHDHDTVNAKGIVLGNDTVDSQHYVADSVDTEHYAPASVNTTALKTSTGSSASTVTTGTTVAVTMQDYCFFPNIGTDAADDLTLWAYTTIAASTYTGRFAFKNEDGATRNYSIWWRYVTASDEPFIYAIRDKTTGQIIGTWMCEDPPPGYWGLDKKPVDFEPPMIYTPALTNVEEIVIFKYPMDGYKELMDRSKVDKVLIHDMLTADFDYNNGSKLFTAKNLVHI